MNKTLLPVGSVVMLNGASKAVMIFGHMVTANDNQTYDYMACLFPEGYVSSEYIFFFNAEDVTEVRFTGYHGNNDDLAIIKELYGDVAFALPPDDNGGGSC